MSLKKDTILANRYQIREQLSKKSRRSTFLARDLDSQSLVIIKILRFDKVSIALVSIYPADIGLNLVTGNLIGY